MNQEESPGGSLEAEIGNEMHGVDEVHGVKKMYRLEEVHGLKKCTDGRKLPEVEVKPEFQKA